jgi:large subunit ribosomal protein L24
MEKAIDASNVMLVCPFTNKPTRVGFVTIEEKGKSKKFRFSKVAVKENKGDAKKFIIK